MLYYASGKIKFLKLNLLFLYNLFTYFVNHKDKHFALVVFGFIDYWILLL